MFNIKEVAKFLQESDRIEGIDTKAQHYIQEISGNKNKNKYVKNSVWAWEYVRDNYKKEPDIVDILALHKRQMLGLLRNEEIGNFRKYHVTIGNHMPCNPASVVYKISSLVEGIGERSPMDVHCEFENIHPFPDGNGRVGRLLWLWMELNKGAETITPFLDEFLELWEEPGEVDFFELRARYYTELRKYQARKKLQGCSA